jgi:hypothetical protein
LKDICWSMIKILALPPYSKSSKTLWRGDALLFFVSLPFSPPS